MNKYLVMDREKEVVVEASSLYEAKAKYLAENKVPKKYLGLLVVALVEKGGAPVAHNPAEL